MRSLLGLQPSSDPSLIKTGTREKKRKEDNGLEGGGGKRGEVESLKLSLCEILQRRK